MKHLKTFALLAFTFIGVMATTTSCAKEGTCECTGVFSDNRPDSTFTEIRPNGNKDCTFLEGENFSGSVSWTITCTKIN
jgi:hypothetical protein